MEEIAMRNKFFTLAIITACSLFLMSCQKESGTNPVTPVQKPGTKIKLGTITVQKADLAKVLNLQMLSASYDRQEAESSLGRIGPLFLALGGKDLDIDALINMSLPFVQNGYEVSYGSDHLRLVFCFAEEFGSFKAGDTIPYNLFALNSYVRNITITWEGIQYDKGPLFDLITGKIEFDGLKPKITIGAQKLLVSMEYSGFRKIRQPDTTLDTLRLLLRASQANLQTLANELTSSGYTFDIDSTFLRTIYYDAKAYLAPSNVSIRKSNNIFMADGEISGHIDQKDISFYFRGLYSSNGTNVTDYYLTPAFSERVGTSQLANNLKSGMFRSAGGDTLSFQRP